MEIHWMFPGIIGQVGIKLRWQWSPLEQNPFRFFKQVKETDLDKAIMCLSGKYKIFMDKGAGLEPVTLSFARRIAGALSMTSGNNIQDTIYTAGI